MKKLLLLPALALQLAGMVCGGWFVYLCLTGIPPHMFKTSIVVGSIGVVLLLIGSGVADAVR